MLNSRFASKIARAVSRLLAHKCTLVRFVDSGNTNENGQPIYTELKMMSISCLLVWQDRSVTDERGTFTERTPLVYFSSSQSISVGDRVETVLTPNRVILLKGAAVRTINSTAEGGNEAMKLCELEGAVV
jgi:hypothetical protein